MKALFLVASAAFALAGVARAEVVDKGPSHFRLKNVVRISAPPAKVFRSIGEIGRWWSDSHTYSGKAANMTLALTANGCFCEVIPAGGGVRHGVVELVIPERQIRLDAPLGPLQDEGVGAAWTFDLKPRDGGTELTVTYHVGGAREFIVSAAPGVDGVLTEAVGRLKRYVETGAP